MTKPNNIAAYADLLGESAGMVAQLLDHVHVERGRLTPRIARNLDEARRLVASLRADHLPLVTAALCDYAVLVDAELKRKPASDE